MTSYLQGSTEDGKLEGPMSQVDAEKCFKNKFMEKTENSWDNRSRFVPVDGQYTLDETTTAISLVSAHGKGPRQISSISLVNQLKLCSL